MTPMSLRVLLPSFVLLMAAAPPLLPQPPDAVGVALRRPILEPGQAAKEVSDYCEARVLRMPEIRSRKEWERYAARMRRETLQRAVFRGEAARWRDAEGRVEWLDSIPGGPGYRIRKLRYEALPGLWIPALLYEPEQLQGRVPVILNVNGHDAKGKAADYKQIRCINLAKRGMLVLNPEWLGMGQLSGAEYGHDRINAIDLCGTSGLAAHYLALSRGLDVLLSLPDADPKRVAVSGLSGGGWQTILISSLDPRVTLSNPVAGYSSFRTRARYATDLGDSEQTPTDLGTVTDYAHMTAMRAPQPTLLTYNAKDDCCFQSGHALPPLLEAATPAFTLFGREQNLRSHVNHDPGTHNFLKDNREAFYRMIGDHFFPGDGSYRREEIPSEAEVKTPEQLAVPLPMDNRSLQRLAVELSRDLPRRSDVPERPEAARKWQRERREELRRLVRAHDYRVTAQQVGAEEKDGLRAVSWRLRVGDWTLPAVELTRGTPRKTVLVVADGGRAAAEALARKHLEQGARVIAVDPFYVGEWHMGAQAYLWALFVGTVGDRPLGLQASQLGAVARWAGEGQAEPVTLVASGARMSVAALVTGALEEKAVGGLELHGAPGSLKETIERAVPYSQAPELFCFGLLEAFDIPQLAALSAPRSIVWDTPRPGLRSSLQHR